MGYRKRQSKRIQYLLNEDISKKKLSLLIPINEEIYDRLREEERTKYAEMNTQKYEEATKTPKRVSA